VLIRKRRLSLFALPLATVPWALNVVGPMTADLRSTSLVAVRHQSASHADLMLRGRFAMSTRSPGEEPVGLSVTRLSVEDVAARRRERAAAWASAQAAADAKAKASADSQSASSSAQTIGAGGWGPLLSQYPWDTGLAYQVMMCESHGDPGAVNSNSGATGLFQILGGPSDPVANVALAYDMYSHRGWQPWSSSSGCWG
jgi:hypothetical protein